VSVHTPLAEESEVFWIALVAEGGEPLGGRRRPEALSEEVVADETPQRGPPILLVRDDGGPLIRRPSRIDHRFGLDRPGAPVAAAAVAVANASAIVAAPRGS